MRRVPRSTVLLFGLLVGLVAVLGLVAYHQRVEGREPIQREINGLVATVQNPLELPFEAAPASRDPATAWPIAVLGVGFAALWLLRQRRRGQQRSRSNPS